eukprot:3340553-Prymnesium_polylepis.1
MAKRVELKEEKAREAEAKAKKAEKEAEEAKAKAEEAKAKMEEANRRKESSSVADRGQLYHLECKQRYRAETAETEAASARAEAARTRVEAESAVRAHAAEEARTEEMEKCMRRLVEMTEDEEKQEAAMCVLNAVQA